MADKVLEDVAKVSVESAVDFDPKEYFKTRNGLYVWSDFDERILSKAETVKESIKFDLSSFKLLKYAEDKDIESELPEKHIFSETEVCALIAALIEKQPKGEEGTLLNTGNWNLFYTPTFVVCVLWSSNVEDWHVDAWRRDNYGWDGDFRVFSPAN